MKFSHLSVVALILVTVPYQPTSAEDTTQVKAPDPVGAGDSSRVTPAGSTLVRIESEPSGLGITLNGEITDPPTPHNFHLPPGSHQITVFGEDWEPLSYTIGLDSLTALSLRFLMRPAPPPRPTPESIGLAYEPQLPLQDERAAAQIRESFNQLAETFLIFPFAQGVILKIALEEHEQETANAFLISGGALSLGSYFLGRVLSKRKLGRIRRYNEEALLANQQADAFNEEVDATLDSIYQAQYDRWETETDDRGQVVESVP